MAITTVDYNETGSITLVDGKGHVTHELRTISPTINKQVVLQIPGLETSFTVSKVTETPRILLSQHEPVSPLQSVRFIIQSSLITAGTDYQLTYKTEEFDDANPNVVLNTSDVSSWSHTAITNNEIILNTSLGVTNTNTNGRTRNIYTVDINGATHTLSWISRTMPNSSISGYFIREGATNTTSFPITGLLCSTPHHIGYRFKSGTVANGQNITCTIEEYIKPPGGTKKVTKAKEGFSLTVNNNKVLLPVTFDVITSGYTATELDNRKFIIELTAPTIGKVMHWARIKNATS